jgi:hypothetical protein
MSETQTTQLRAVQVSRGTYELRQVVSASVREQRSAPMPPEREPLTWEEYLSLPAEQRQGGRY